MSDAGTEDANMDSSSAPRPATPDGVDDIGGGGATSIPAPASVGAETVGVEGVRSNPLKRSIGDADTGGEGFGVAFAGDTSRPANMPPPGATGTVGFGESSDGAGPAAGSAAPVTRSTAEATSSSRKTSCAVHASRSPASVRFGIAARRRPTRRLISLTRMNCRLSSSGCASRAGRRER